MDIEKRVLALLAGGWAFLVSSVNTYLIAWGSAATGESADWTEPLVAVLRICAVTLAFTTLLFVIVVWPSLLAAASAASAVVLPITWIICLGIYQDVSDVVYAIVVTLLMLPGTLGLAGVWAAARSGPPEDPGPPRWMA